MNSKVKRFSSLFLALVIFFTTIASNTMDVFAQSGVITSLNVSNYEISHAQSFNVEVAFGGPGFRVSAGQTEQIRFDTDNVNIKLPGKPIVLNDRNGIQLGTVTFSGDVATITFNDHAASLEDVGGEFNFYAHGYYSGDTSQNGKGSIRVNYGNESKDIGLSYQTGGVATSELYSKKGVWIHDDDIGNRVDWVFSVNPAKTSTSGNNSGVYIYDTLPDTMEWDMEYNNANPYVVKLGEKWLTIEEARGMGILINAPSQDLTVKIPHLIAINGGYSGYMDPLDGQHISIRLAARVKDEVMADPSITSIANTSTIDTGNLDWDIPDTNLSDNVAIERSGGWISGTKPGEIKIVKKLKDTEEAIEGVEFTLTKEDGSDIELSKGDGTYENMGPSTTIVTDSEGKAILKGLSQGTYVLKETNAPEGIKFDPSNPETRVFNISSDDTEGKLFDIYNEKEELPQTPETIDINVSKEWKDHTGETIEAPVESVKVQLYKNGLAEGDPVELNDNNSWYHNFENLEKSETIDSDPYEYTVVELDSEGNAVTDTIKIEEDTYKVEITGSMAEGFTVTNSKEFKQIPLEPSKRSVEVEKEWKDHTGKAITAPVKSVSVQLYKDGQAEGEPVELNQENSWSYKFEDLKTSETINSDPYEYTVKEVNAEDGRVSLAGDTYKVEITGSMAKGYTVTNSKEFKWLPLEPSNTSIEVEKEWKSEYGLDIAAPVESIQVELYRDGQATGNKMTLSALNYWKVKFEDLKTSETINSDPYEYTVVELDSEGNAVTDTINIEEDTYKVEITGSMAEGFTVTNSKEFKQIPLEPSKRSIEVEKEWKDHTGKTINAPVKSVSVQLYKDGQAEGEPVELNEENSWSHKFEDLKTSETINSDPYEYTVVELDSEGNVVADTIKIEEDTYKVEITGNMAEGFTVTNSKEFKWLPLEPSNTSVEVEKEWKSEYGLDIAAPVESIQVELYRDGQATGNKMTLSALNDWKVKFEDLKTSETINSDPYEYTVVELDSEGNVVTDTIKIEEDTYKVEITGNMAEGFTVTNSKEFKWLPLEPSKRSVEVEKEWKSEYGLDIAAPVESIQVELYRDGQATGNKMTLSALNDWKVKFEDLKTSETINSDPYEYTVVELDSEGNAVTDTIKIEEDTYKVEVTGSMEEGFTVTNSKEFKQIPLEPSKRSIEVEKEWKDHTGKTITAPVKSVSVQLYKDGQAEGEPVELNEENSWSHKFENLKTSETINSDLYEYTVVELDSEGNAVTDSIKIEEDTYKVEVTGSMEEGFTVTNSKEFKQIPLEPSKRSIEVEKEWKDHTGKTITAPVKSVSVQLYKDGQAEGDPVELNEENSWSHKFEDLKTSETINSDPYEYTVKEVNAEDGRVSLDGDTYKVEITGNMEEGFTVTNSKEFKQIPLEPSKRSVEVEKEWKDHTGKSITAPVKSISVQLYKDGQAEGEPVELNEENSWSYKFEDLKTSETINSDPYEYTVAELDSEGNAVTDTIKIEEDTYKVEITGDMAKGFTVTNSKEFKQIPLEPSKRSIEVEKEWKDHTGKAITAPVKSVSVQLYKDGQAEGEPVELNEENSWSYKFEDLKTSETINSDPYEYTVVELDSEGNAVNDTIKIDNDIYKVEITGNMKEGYTVTNSKEFKQIPLEPSNISISVEKEWKNRAGKIIEAPEKSVFVQLYRDGKAEGEPVELNNENAWSHKFDNLKQSETIDSEAYEYTVKELDSEGKPAESIIKLGEEYYKVEITGSASEGFTVTNIKNYDSVDDPKDEDEDLFVRVSGKKTWEDNEDKEGKRPEEITIRLFADGKEIDKKTVNEKDGWKWDFGSLAKYKDEEEIKYTIKEDSVKSYSSKVEGYDVTNTYKPGIIETIKNTSKGKGKGIPWTGSDPVVSSYSIFILLGLAYFINKKFNK